MNVKMMMTACVSLLFAVSSAWGGTVSFDPPVREVDPSISTVTTLEVGIADSVLPMFDAVDMIIGSDDLRIERWDPVWPEYCFWPCYEPAGVYASDLKVGHFGPLMPTGDIVLGTVTVDTIGLTPGTYIVMVDASRDEGRSVIYGAGEGDALFGIGTVQVIPEPGTAALLGVGMLAVMRRRWRARPGGRRKTGLTGCWS